MWTLPISFLGCVASAQLQELSLSSQGHLWFPTTCQPAYFMLWVQPHHGRSNGNERLRVIALRAISYSDGKIWSHTNIHSNFTSAPRKRVLSIERGSDCTAGCKTKVIIVELRSPIGRISSVKVRSLSVLQVRTQSRCLSLNNFLTGRGSCVNSFSLPRTPLVQCKYVGSVPVLRC